MLGVPAAAFSALTGLRDLTLVCNQEQVQYNNFGNAFANLKQLEFLKLTGFKLQTLPQGITQLKNLEFLNVSHNMLEELPEDIGNLKQLRYLNASMNTMISKVPESIGALGNLEVLRLGGNHIETLPVGIIYLSRKNPPTQFPQIEMNPLKTGDNVVQEFQDEGNMIDKDKVTHDPLSLYHLGLMAVKKQVRESVAEQILPRTTTEDMQEMTHKCCVRECGSHYNGQWRHYKLFFFAPVRNLESGNETHSVPIQAYSCRFECIYHVLGRP